jgi:aryl-alcohol dehydrogenase-like predicted oxidoreductase
MTIEATSAFSARTLGRTGLQVSPIGLGVMQFSGGSGLFGLAFPDLSERERAEIVGAALDGGVNWFDTAEIYGFGRSERRLARALRANGMRDDQVIIASKWFPLLRTSRNIPKTIGRRLENLQEYSIDLYYVHQPYSLSSVDAQMDAMARLVDAGEIGAVGVSNFDEKRMRQAHATLAKHGLPLAANQVQYSLMERSIERDGVLDAAEELDITIVAYSPLAKGLLSGKYHRHPELLAQKGRLASMGLQRDLARSRPIVEALEEIATIHEATPAQVALSWIISFHGERVVAIPGATSVEQASQNAGAMALDLASTELDRLDALSKEF